MAWRIGVLFRREVTRLLGDWGDAIAEDDREEPIAESACQWTEREDRVFLVLIVDTSRHGLHTNDHGSRAGDLAPNAGHPCQWPGRTPHRHPAVHRSGHNRFMSRKAK